ncbi:MAG: ABC transporter ATP-binding protein, partial [Pseudomonadota bacterium]
LTLDIRERLGGVAYDYLTAPTGERIVVESKGDNAMSEGTDVSITFDPARVMFFDSTTEARLR